MTGKTEHHPRQIQLLQEPPFQLLVDIQAKLAEGKSEGYARWAKRYNLKEMSKTHPVYDAYRKAGYSKKFLDTHREEITLHKAAKAAFDETGLKSCRRSKH